MAVFSYVTMSTIVYAVQTQPSTLVVIVVCMSGSWKNYHIKITFILRGKKTEQ